MSINFDEIIELRGTHSAKWDGMEKVYGVPAEDGIPMWVADMDFRPPQAVTDALIAAAESRFQGYFGDNSEYLAAITGWMKRRHGWDLDPAAISTTHGLVAGVSLCVQAYTKPGDGVIVFSPVYHAFHRLIRANGREVVESELVNRDGRYEMDLDALEARMDGSQKMVVFCSPHNPGGRIWTPEEQKALADFCARHDLVLVADEIHHNLVFPGEKHTVAPLAMPDAKNRLVLCTGATKSFNIAGIMTGMVIIEDAALRAKFQKAHAAAGASPNRYGMLLTTAAFKHGDEWIDAVMAYIAENRRIFDAGMAAIPGVRNMPMQSTYLAWTDFSALGMEPKEVQERIEKRARIAASHGETFGVGGDQFMRFNLACRKALLEEAIGRLQDAFADLQ
jgi:cystathionine beta-lyase